MALTRPTLLNTVPFDAGSPHVFNFTSSGGSTQITGNTLIIQRNDTLAVVYNNTQTTYTYTHVLPANTLTNGVAYQATIATIGADGSKSVASVPIIFYALANPTFEFTNIPSGNIVNGNSYDFSLQYGQVNDELLNSVTFNIYNASGSVIATSGVLANWPVQPVSISYMFSGFADGTEYYIEAVGQTVRGMVLSTGQIRLVCSYQAPGGETTITATNNCHNGYIAIVASVNYGADDDISSLLVRVKRRIVGQFEWVTIDERQLTEGTGNQFSVIDHLAKSLTEYEYAVVPVINNVEDVYTTTTVLSKFDGVFFADIDNIFELDANVQMGNMQTVQKQGVYEPMGRKYPVVISNGDISYRTGSINGIVLNDNYSSGEPLNRKAILTKRELLVNFLNNRRPKVLKDWNGQIFLIDITSNPVIVYANGSGMGLASITCGWTEIGDADDRRDLYESGLIPTLN